MDNIYRASISLSVEECGIICEMARSGCGNNFKQRELAETNPKATACLGDIEQVHWVKVKFLEHFKTPTYDDIMSNLSEQANNWIGEELHNAKPLDAFSMYFYKLAELLSEKRQMAVNWLSKNDEPSLVPVLLRKRDDLCKTSETYEDFRVWMDRTLFCTV